jgi:hypothetical protein
MTARRLVCIVVAALAGSLAVPPALADTRIAGRTSQGRPVSIVVGDDGRFTQVRISWVTRLCRRRGLRVVGRTVFRPPYDVNDANRVEGVRIHTMRRGRLRIRMTGNFIAERAADGSWSGTVSGGMEVRRRGRTINDCALRLTTWKAAP